MKVMISNELIHADENGNAVIGKNLEIKGTTKFNGGLEPIHNYKIQTASDVYTLIVLFEKYDAVNENYCAFGFLEHEGDSIYPGFFDYSVDKGAITHFYGLFKDSFYELLNGSITQTAISTSSI